MRGKGKVLIMNGVYIIFTLELEAKKIDNRVANFLTYTYKYFPNYFADTLPKVHLNSTCTIGVLPSLYKLSFLDLWCANECQLNRTCSVHARGRIDLINGLKSLVKASFIQSIRQFIFWGLRGFTWVKCPIIRAGRMWQTSSTQQKHVFPERHINK